MSQLAVLTRRWRPAQMKLEPFQEVVLESSSVEELKEKVCVCVLGWAWGFVPLYDFVSRSKCAALSLKLHLHTHTQTQSAPHSS